MSTEILLTFVTYQVVTKYLPSFKITLSKMDFEFLIDYGKNFYL